MFTDIPWRILTSEVRNMSEVTFIIAPLTIAAFNCTSEATSTDSIAAVVIAHPKNELHATVSRAKLGPKLELLHAPRGRAIMCAPMQCVKESLQYS
jgi:hypothetical protein